ncbi:hypothetical protein NYO67_7706 [Aspergillus flavus]|nr:hypothetical protein NYO67_7706 [Aspergillus flavus]
MLFVARVPTTDRNTNFHDRLSNPAGYLQALRAAGLTIWSTREDIALLDEESLEALLISLLQVLIAQEVAGTGSSYTLPNLSLLIRSSTINLNRVSAIDERKTKVHPEILVLLKHLLVNDLIVPCPRALPDDVDDTPTDLLLYMLTSISLDDQVELHHALKIKTIDMYAKVREYQIRFAVHYSKRSLLRYFDSVTASDEPMIPWSSMPL